MNAAILVKTEVRAASAILTILYFLETLKNYFQKMFFYFELTEIIFLTNK